MRFHKLKIYCQFRLLVGDAVQFKNNLKKYLDDCFILRHENLDTLTRFKNMLNNLNNNNIHLTMEFKTKELAFLDILITNKDKKV